jgi:hypothetical protein
MRLDAVISGVLNCSRNEGVGYIKQGLVSVNHLAAKRPDFEIIDNDIEDKAMTFFYHALTNLRYNALKKIERLKYIEWNVLNPTILIKDENDNIIQQKISSIKYDDENLILFFENDTKEYLFNELTFCGHSSIELYRAILFYDLINN